MADDTTWPPVDIDTTPPRRRGRRKADDTAPPRPRGRPKSVLPFRGVASIRLDSDTYHAVHEIHGQTGLPLQTIVNAIVRGYYRQMPTPRKALFIKAPYGIVEMLWGVEVGEFAFNDTPAPGTPIPDE